MEVVYLDEVDTCVEPINTDYETNETCYVQRDKISSHRDSVSSQINMDSMTEVLLKQHRPIKRETRTIPLELSVPIKDAMFATVEDFLAATK